MVSMVYVIHVGLIWWKWPSENQPYKQYLCVYIIITMEPKVEFKYIMMANYGAADPIISSQALMDRINSINLCDSCKSIPNTCICPKCTACEKAFLAQMHTVDGLCICCAEYLQELIAY
jgi:hypothetical protein